MNDERLERELRRRGEAVPTSNAWVRDELLPGIRARMIGPNPKRVPMNRLPAAAALVALIAVLTVLVLGLPSGNHQPVAQPSSSDGPVSLPSPSTVSAPLVLSAKAFAAALAAGDLRGSTVLVEGQIEAGSPVPRAFCDPHNACYLGELAGADPPINVLARGIAVPESDSAMYFEIPAYWPWWHTWQLPLAGTLVLSIGDDRVVEYLGLVRPGSDGVAWRADQFIEDEPTVAVDDAVVVDGWLIGHGVTFCPPNEEPRPLRDLPSRRCSSLESWLSSRDELFDSALSRDHDGVRVQNGAYDAFAVEPEFEDGLAVPRRGQYVLARRLQGAGCDVGETEPCFAWEVLGRIDAGTGSPAASRAPTASPPPTASSAPTQPIPASPSPSPSGATEPSATPSDPLPTAPPSPPTGLDVTMRAGPDGLRTFTAIHNINGVVVACPAFAVTNPVRGRLEGDPDDDLEPIWLRAADGPRLSVVWPHGFRVRFEPDAVLYNDRGNAVARAGQMVELGQTAMDEHTGTFDDPYIASGGVLGGCHPDIRALPEPLPSVDDAALGQAFTRLGELSGGDDTCMRHLDWADFSQFERAAEGIAEGPTADGRSWVGDPLDAIRYARGFEVFVGQGYWFIAWARDAEWIDLPAETPMIIRLQPVPLEDGRRSWVPGASEYAWAGPCSF